METIAGAWKYLAQLGSGVGLVVLLRWFWWRGNAPVVGSHFASELVTIVAVSTVVWLTMTFQTKPTEVVTLPRFYRRIRRGGWWGAARGALPIWIAVLAAWYSFRCVHRMPAHPTVPGFGEVEAHWLDSRRTGTRRNEFLVRATEENASMIEIAVDQTQQNAGPETWILRHPLSTSGRMNVLFGGGHVEIRAANQIRSRWGARPVRW